MSKESLDTFAGWRARARLVRPDARPSGWTGQEGEPEPLYRQADTVPIESEADLDATSAAPAQSRYPGVYDYGSAAGPKRRKR
ncbi:hypothetical protein [Halorhodospira neutriphila]|uniref:Uncharacterized protein n=1 Tax=Halorhodospira neutriphila TaxID=168379 RepID=A0ABS1E302_9GAMM|nr:hypothetical protein [Halorhodospira neutriphila]MBK1725855.1 hypothetical protein [Halorhodospira neutriphila]